MGDTEKLLDMLRSEQLKHAKTVDKLLKKNAELLEALWDIRHHLRYIAGGNEVFLKAEDAIARATSVPETD